MLRLGHLTTISTRRAATGKVQASRRAPSSVGGWLHYRGSCGRRLAAQVLARKAAPCNPGTTTYYYHYYYYTITTTTNTATTTPLLPPLPPLLLPLLPLLPLLLPTTTATATTTTQEQRTTYAVECASELGLTGFRLCVDGMADELNAALGAWPTAYYVLNRSGELLYIGGSSADSMGSSTCYNVSLLLSFLRSWQRHQASC